MSERVTAVRIAENQSRFRRCVEEADERIVVGCECADPLCTERVSMTREEYERIRSDPRRFFVVEAHRSIAEEGGVVVESHEQFLVVEKPADR